MFRDERHVVNPLLAIVLVVWAISALGLIVFVLLHSGKGTGLSEMLGGALSPTATGTSIIEKNLDRITIGFAVAFMVSLLILMLIYPTAG
jgi:preprotein translocase subunit SecG